MCLTERHTNLTRRISNEKQLYINHHVSAPAPLSYLSPGGRHRVRVGAGRALKPGGHGAHLRRLAVRDAGACRTAVGVHHHVPLVALFIGCPLRPHDGEGRRRRQQAHQYQRTLLFRLDAARDWRAWWLLRHPLGARTVEPAMAPAPLVQPSTLTRESSQESSALCGGARSITSGRLLFVVFVAGRWLLFPSPLIKSLFLVFISSLHKPIVKHTHTSARRCDVMDTKTFLFAAKI